jgi:rhodanese-related sulfurtransferase
LRLAGQLAGELLLLDFAAFTSMRLKAPRRPECVAPGCALIRDLGAEESDLELRLPSLAAARERRFELIDVRTAEEVAAEPTEARHIPMAALLADPQALAAGPRYLLICASGKRSLAAARELRRRGLDARSLAGGLESLGPGSLGK